MTTITVRLLNPITETREQRTFAVPTDGGYVIEILPPDASRLTADRPQVCGRLDGHGDTLYVGGGEGTAMRLRRRILLEQRRRLAAYRRLDTTA